MTSSDTEASEGRLQLQGRGRRGARLHECSTELEVPFHDVDALRIVWHGHYYKYMEIARTQLLRSRKLDVKDLISLGHGLLVIESACRHTAPLRYGDRVRIAAWFGDVTHRILIAYELSNLSLGVRSARGHTTLVATTPTGEMLHRTPDSIAARLLPRGPSTDELQGATR
ncbi:MAG: acyl-CoA thioesterase [bacterium]|nr:acyl-CoA thioesterase [bacterium]